MTASNSNSIVTSVSGVINNPSLQAHKNDYERLEGNSDDLDVILEREPSEVQNDSSIELMSPSNTQKTKTTTVHEKGKDPSKRRWIVLASFSLLSFSNAVLWITFGPCLYIFMDHYRQTASRINALATVYMILY